MKIVFLFSLATAPILGFIIYYYHKDKYEKEPLRLLIKAFIGGCLIFIPVCIYELMFGYTLIRSLYFFDRVIYLFIYSFLGIGIIEEGFKFFVVRFYLYNKDDFNEPYDGVIYAIMVSLGFAFVENLGYVFLAAFKYGAWLGINTAITRGVLSIPMHSFLGAIMGYYLGMAKFCADNIIKRKYIKKALIIPVVFHSLYDYFVLLKSILGYLISILLVLYLGFFVFKMIRLLSEISLFRYNRQVKKNNSLY